MQEKIKQECINYNKNEKESHKKSLSKTANDFRVFFKKIKNIFVTIKQKIRRGNEDNFTNNFKFS
ncbi:hypothetical protein CLN41_08830 [Campylobacter coli]|nr:hypothetical protein [Campylobacter coli]